MLSVGQEDNTSESCLVDFIKNRVNRNFCLYDIAFCINDDDLGVIITARMLRKYLGICVNDYISTVQTSKVRYHPGPTTILVPSLLSWEHVVPSVYPDAYP